MSSLDYDEASLTRIIARLKTGASQRALAEEERAFEYYLDPENNSNASHWYCFRASILLRDIATFSQQKLVATAHDDPRIHKWKKQHSFVMDSCPDCVKAMEESLLESQTTFLSAYKRERVSAYLEVHFEWNAQRILAHLHDLKSSTVDALPLAVSYHLIYNPHILSHPKIWPLVLERIPEAPVDGWPKGVPPGLALLLIQSDGPSRKWARMQARRQDRMAEEKSNDDSYHARVCKAILAALDASTGPKVAVPSECAFRLSLNGLPSSTIWATLPSLTHQFGELYEAKLHAHDSKNGNIKATQTLLSIAVRHLSRTDTAFLPVLRAFTHVLESRSETAWIGHSPELPQLALNSLKENSCLCTFDTHKESAMTTHFGWIEPFLQSTLALPSSNALIHQIVQLFAEDIQHERFGDRRSLIFDQFIKAFAAAFDLQRADNTHKQAIIEATVVHQAAIIAVAFAKKFNDRAWSPPRKSTRHFLFNLLEFDISQIHLALCSIRDLERTKDPRSITVSPSYSVLWSKFRGVLSSDDLEGYTLLLKLTSNAANLVAVSPERLNTVLAQTKSPLLPPNVCKKLEQIANAIQVIQAGLSDCIIRLVSAVSSPTIATFCHRDDITVATVTLLLSPALDLSNSVQTLLAQAYNTDSRIDGLRVLLEFRCEITLNTMVTYLQQFLASSKAYLEHVQAAKTVVICFTDVLDILCARGSGLLFNTNFKAENRVGLKQLSQLWRVMCETGGDIIERTPDWARRYPSNEMTPWMRDALIFADQLLDQRHVFESAITEHGSFDDLGSGISFGTSLGETAERILRPLVSWLRLTDDELLSRSFNLFLKILDAFVEADAKPAEELTSSIETMLRRWEKNMIQSKVNDGKSISTKLSSAQIGTILRRTSQIRGEENSEIEFLSQSFSPQKPKRFTAPGVPPTDGHSGGRSNTNTRTQQRYGKPSFKTPSTATKPSIGPSIVGRGNTMFDQASATRAIEERRAAKNVTKQVKPAAVDVIESSDSSESEGESGLQQLIRLQTSSEIARKPERRRAILLNGAVKTSRIEIGQKIKAKFIPDLTPLHRIILTWNYDHTGPEPPDMTGSLVYKPVPASFWGHRQYLEIFHPLLLLECWNGLVKSKEDQLEKVPCTVSGKMVTDTWVEIDIAIGEALQPGWGLVETDIVLLEHASGVRTLAKVHSFRDNKQGLQSTLRYSNDAINPDFERSMALKSSWFISRVFSLSTVHREYAALLGLGSYELEDFVLQARIEPLPVPTEASITRTMASHKLNYPQAKAVLSSLQTLGFSLIQGPPGTGKTSTICGLVGVFLSSRDSATTSVVVGASGQTPVPRKVLICAPSNAAIDEVARRLREGVWNADGRRIIPRVVRLGALSAISLSIRDLSLDQMVESRISGTHSTAQDTGNEVSSLRGRLAEIKRLRQEKQTELSMCRDNAAHALDIDRELRDLTSKRTQITNQLNAALDKGRETTRAADSAKRKARVDVLNEVDIVCCTLSGSGHEIIDRMEFDLIIIDEAAQAIELSSLIPLKFASQRCVLVGDPQQLPPTVLSQTATKLGYNRSLFVRLQESIPDRIHLLSIQYRMHPEISRLPSLLFYEGKLQDGPNMAVQTRQPWHGDPNLGTYRLFDVRGSEERVGMGHSQYNIAEVRAALELYKKLRSAWGISSTGVTVGVISMYRAQLAKLRDAFIAQYGRDILSRVDFNTVDGFQGQEKDVIILSCVRAGPNVSAIGFLSDARRVNVAITRCRSSLFILGDAATLKRSDHLWSKIVADAIDRGSLVQIGDKDSRISEILSSRIPMEGDRPGRRLPRQVEMTRPQEILPEETVSIREASTSTGMLPLKRRLSSPEDHSQEPPAIRPALKRGDAAEIPTDAEEGPSQVRKAIPSRPKVPKAKATSLFIPKKPTRLPK